VGELRERTSFFDEELAKGCIPRGVRIEHLDRDLAAEREVDLRRPAGADGLEDPVALIEDAIHSQLRAP